MPVPLRGLVALVTFRTGLAVPQTVRDWSGVKLGLAEAGALRAALALLVLMVAMVDGARVNFLLGSSPVLVAPL